MERSITLPFSHFVCQGYAQVNMWGGGKGRIKMDSFRISDGYTEDQLKQCVNDGGFGCDSIDGAIIDMYAVYTDGITEAKRYVKTVTSGTVTEPFMFDEDLQ